MKPLLVTAVLVMCAAPVGAGVVSREVAYRHDDTQLRGYLAYDDSSQGKLPGILVVHEWWGLNEYARQRARQLAAMGYTAFAADMYGKGTTTQDPKKAAALSGHVKGGPLLRERARAALDVLLTRDRVDPGRVAAIGFCFGGTTVLELAYSGADLAGVVSFHGGLPPLGPEDRHRVKAKILVLHGSQDPFVDPMDISDFQEQLDAGGVDWQMVIYGGAVHSFSNPAAAGAGIPGVDFDQEAAERSWNHMELFFNQTFSERGSAR